MSTNWVICIMTFITQAKRETVQLTSALQVYDLFNGSGDGAKDLTTSGFLFSFQSDLLPLLLYSIHRQMTRNYSQTEKIIQLDIPPFIRDFSWSIPQTIIILVRRPRAQRRNNRLRDPLPVCWTGAIYGLTSARWMTRGGTGLYFRFRHTARQSAVEAVLCVAAGASHVARYGIARGCIQRQV